MWDEKPLRRGQDVLWMDVSSFVFPQFGMQVRVLLTVCTDPLVSVESDREALPAVITPLLSLLIVRPCEAAGWRRRECNHTSSTDKY